jgi:hypothetical protein
VAAQLVPYVGGFAARPARTGVRAREDVEVYPAATAGGPSADYQVELMQENVYGDAWLTGRYTRLANPRTTFAVREPVRGCGSLATTSETSKANNCAIGVNAGAHRCPRARRVRLTGRASMYARSVCLSAYARPSMCLYGYARLSVCPYACVSVCLCVQASLTRARSTASATWLRMAAWCRRTRAPSTRTLGCGLLTARWSPAMSTRPR